MAKTPKLDAQGYRKFGILDKLSYAAGDAGCNCSFALAGGIFTTYWTQYMQIDALFFAALLIAFKVWDAINDTLIGSIMDASTKEYKRGKFLTYIAFGSFLLAGAACVCFLPIPNAPMVVKCLICTIGYVAWDAAYTIVNGPYGAMLSNITAVPGERAQLGAWRNLGSMVISLPIGVILPMFLYDANQNIKGEILFPLALVLGVIALALFWFMIKTTVFRVKANITVSEEKFNLFKSAGKFMKNRAALGATLIPVAMFLGQYGAQVCTTVVFQAYFKQAQMSGLMQMIGMLPMMLFIPFAKPITNKFGKKEAAAFCSMFSVVACIVMNIVPMPANMTGVLIYVALSFVHGVGLGCGMMLSNAMMADAIDYNEWKFGVREEGTVYALHSFFRKLAQGIGPAVALAIMVAMGYVGANQGNQTAEVALNMRYLVSYLYTVAAVFSFVGLTLVYNLDKKKLAKMNEELTARRGVSAE